MPDENTPTKTPMQIACPTCKGKVLWNEDFPERPFCSERCKLMDFGDWANESNSIEGNSIYDDVNSDDLDQY